MAVSVLKFWPPEGLESSAYTPPAPVSLKVTLQDVDGSSATRSSNGTLIRDRIAGGSGAKRKVELEWGLLKPATAAALLQAAGGTFIMVRYPDPYTGAFRTCEMYAGDKTAPAMRIDPDSGEVLWGGISFNLIER